LNKIIIVGLGIGLAVFLNKRYIISSPHEILAKTGFMIANV
jgi:hypothetical protein